MPTPSQIVVRRAVESDLPALGRMGAELMRVHFAFDPRRFMDPGADPDRRDVGPHEAHAADEAVGVEGWSFP